MFKRFHHWPLLAAITAYSLLASAVLIVSVTRNQGRLVYALDDAYIHLSMARNLASHGVWGVKPHEFSATSSSPLWLCLLSILDRLAGPSETTPLVLNLLLGLLLIAVCYHFLELSIDNSLLVAAALLAIVLAGPIIPLAFTGMEHLLHIFLTVILVLRAVSILAGEEPSRRGSGLLFLLAFLLTAARFEGIFLIGVVVALLILRKKQALAPGLLIAGLLPIVLHGILSASHGWYFLPNSILLKTAFSDTSTGRLVGLLGGSYLFKMKDAPHLVVLVLLTLSFLLLWLLERSPVEQQQPAESCQY